jgi:hypothetical protein
VGVFRSIDGGATWTELHTGLNSTNVFALAIDAQDGRIYAATANGVFSMATGE